MDEVFPGRPQSFRYQRRPVDDCRPGRGGMAQESGRSGGTFHGERIAARNARTGLRHAIVVWPNVTGRTKEMIAQSERAHAGSFAIVDYAQVT